MSEEQIRLDDGHRVDTLGFCCRCDQKWPCPAEQQWQRIRDAVEYRASLVTIGPDGVPRPFDVPHSRDEPGPPTVEELGEIWRRLGE